MATPNYAAVTVNQANQQLKVQWVEGQDATNYLELGTQDFDAKTDHKAGSVSLVWDSPHGFTATSKAVEKVFDQTGPHDSPCDLTATFVSSDGKHGILTVTATRDGAVIEESSASVTNAQVHQATAQPQPQPKG
jgi:hypothetical protein